MKILKELYNIKEEAATGSISASSVAVNQNAGFADRDKNSIGNRRNKKNLKLIKRIFTEDKEYDKDSIMAKIKNSEKTIESNKNITGFALEDDNGSIIKVYVKKEQSKEFEEALNTELANNQNDEYKHREISEIIYNLKNDFDIINIEMGEIEEDEEEIEDVQIEDTKSNLKLEDEPDPDSKDLTDDENDGEMNPDLTTDNDSNTSSALNAVIDMMKSDAEAKQAEAEAKKKEAEAKIAALNTQASEAQVKKSEEIMDMEAYYNKKSEIDKESKQLSKLAQYKHDLANDEVEPNKDFVDTDIKDNQIDNIRENFKPGKYLKSALMSLSKIKS